MTQRSNISQERYTKIPSAKNYVRVLVRQRGSKIPFSSNLSKSTIKLWNYLYECGKAKTCDQASKITKEIGKIVGLEGCSISAIAKEMTSDANWEKTKGFIALLD